MHMKSYKKIKLNKLFMGVFVFLCSSLSFTSFADAYGNGGYVSSDGKSVGFKVKAGNANHFAKSPNGYYARLICGDKKIYFGSGSTTLSGKETFINPDVCKKYRGAICVEYGELTAYAEIKGSRSIAGLGLSAGSYDCYFSYYIRDWSANFYWDDKPNDKVSFTVKTADNSNKASADGYYACGTTCHYYAKGVKLPSNCGTTKYNSATDCLANYGTTCSSSVSGAYEIYKAHKFDESSCNKLYDENYYSIWDDSNNCCKFSIRNNQSPNTGGTTGGSTTTTSRILFDQNYGYGLSCDAGFTAPTAGVCQKDVNKGTTVSFPSTSSNMYRENQGQLIGWTKTVTNGAPDCTKGVIEKDLSQTISVNSNTDYYACYQEIISGWRYLQKGYSADGTEDLTCATKTWIEYCNKENGTNYCYYKDSNTGVYRKIYRDKITETFDSANVTCTNDAVEDKGYRWVTTNGDNYSCGDQLYITTCTDDSCNYTKISSYGKDEISENGTIDIDYLDDNRQSTKEACDKLDEETSKCSNPTKKNMRKTSSYTICYDEDTSHSKVKERLQEYYLCDTKNGYKFDKSAIKATGKESCNSKGVCKRTYTVSCTKGDSAKPTLSVKSGIVQSNGYGTITVNAYAKEGATIDSYYASDNYLVPTDSSNWKKLNSKTFTIESSPGIMYIWVRDSKGNISNAVSGAVIDTVNSNTTVKKLELYDANGNVQTPSSISYNVDTVKDNKYVRLSNDLSKDSKVVADSFNPYDMEYKLEVNSPTISVYATLTSTDSNYVDGYEPRTVNLNYGVNTILIKIKNNEGIVRTYTILVTRTDGRTSDNTLSNISLSVGDINFNANVTDYKIEIPTSTTSINVNSTIASDKASYVSGYKPGNVEITGDTTVKLLKVKSETGSTRTYVLTFIKEGTDVIAKESLQLEDLVIPGVYIPFEEDVANYSLSVGYETDTIDLNTTLKDENSVASISIKKKGDSSYNNVSGTGVGLDVGENFIEIRIIDSENEESYYRLTIIRKEFGLEISNDTTLKDLKVLDYDIDFEPSKKEYTVRIKQEKSLVITAVPNNNRAEVFIRGNDELTGFSTVRVKVVAENGEYETYSIDIKKDAFNKTIEIASIVAGVVIILISSGIIIVKKKAKANREYFEE